MNGTSVRAFKRAMAKYSPRLFLNHSTHSAWIPFIFLWPRYQITHWHVSSIRRENGAYDEDNGDRDTRCLLRWKLYNNEKTFFILSIKIINITVFPAMTRLFTTPGILNMEDGANFCKKKKIRLIHCYF